MRLFRLTSYAVFFLATLFTLSTKSAFALCDPADGTSVSPNPATTSQTITFTVVFSTQGGTYCPDDTPIWLYYNNTQIGGQLTSAGNTVSTTAQISQAGTYAFQMSKDGGASKVYLSTLIVQSGGGSCPPQKDPATTDCPAGPINGSCSAYANCPSLQYSTTYGCNVCQATGSPPPPPPPPPGGGSCGGLGAQCAAWGVTYNPCCATTSTGEPLSCQADPWTSPNLFSAFCRTGTGASGSTTPICYDVRTEKVGGNNVYRCTFVCTVPGLQTGRFTALECQQFIAEVLRSPTPTPIINMSANGPCTSSGQCTTIFGWKFNVSSPSAFVSQFFRLALGIAGAIAVLLIIYAGYVYMLSRGDKQKIAGARETIISALTGLVFISLAIAVLGFLGYNVLKVF